MKYYTFAVTASVVVYTKTEAEARKAVADVCISLDVSPGFYKDNDDSRGATISLPANSAVAPVLTSIYDENTGHYQEITDE